MRINIIRLNAETQIKVYEKHNINAEEIEQILKDDKPIFRKEGGNQYRAIGVYNRYITIFFEYDQKTKQATITTAYPSNKKQIKHYKKVNKL